MSSARDKPADSQLCLKSGTEARFLSVSPSFRRTAPWDNERTSKVEVHLAMRILRTLVALFELSVKGEKGRHKFKLRHTPPFPSFLL